MTTPTWKVVMYPTARRYDRLGACFKTLTVEAHTGAAAEEEALAMWGPRWAVCNVKRLTGYEMKGGGHG